MPRLLAIDYGTKRTGIAATDPLQIIATPLETVDTHRLEAWLDTYLAKEPVEAIIIGFPVDDKGIPAEFTPHIAGLQKRLGKKYPHIATHRHDERYTSRMAGQAILASGLGKKARQDKSLRDRISAAIILQSFMESRH